MPSIVKQTLPEGVSLEILDAVTVEMNVDTDPAARVATGWTSSTCTAWSGAVE